MHQSGIYRIISAVLFTAIGNCAASSAAWAQSPTAADMYFDKGQALMADGKFAEACPNFAASYKEDPALGALFRLAECHVAAGHRVAAIQSFGEYLKQYRLLPPEKQAIQDTEKRSATAIENIDKLGKELGQLRVKLDPSVPEGTKLSMDGLVVEGREVEVYVEPGPHVLNLRLPNGKEQTPTQVTAEKGKVTPIELKVDQPRVQPPISPPPIAPHDESTQKRTAAYVVGGVGLAGLGVGLVMGGLAWNKAGYILERCEASGRCRDQQAFDEASLAKADAETYGRISDIGMGVGVVGLGVSTILFVLSKPEKKAASTGWMRVDVDSLGGQGMMGRMGGSW